MLVGDLECFGRRPRVANIHAAHTRDTAIWVREIQHVVIERHDGTAELVSAVRYSRIARSREAIGRSSSTRHSVCLGVNVCMVSSFAFG
jgi:hypothetical protein